MEYCERHRQRRHIHMHYTNSMITQKSVFRKDINSCCGRQAYNINYNYLFCRVTFIFQFKCNNTKVIIDCLHVIVNINLSSYTAPHYELCVINVLFTTIIPNTPLSVVPPSPERPERNRERLTVINVPRVRSLVHVMCESFSSSTSKGPNVCNVRYGPTDPASRNDYKFADTPHSRARA